MSLTFNGILIVTHKMQKLWGESLILLIFNNIIVKIMVIF